MTEPAWIVRGETVGLTSPTKEGFIERWMHHGNDPILMMRVGNPLPPVTRTALEQTWQRAESGAWRIFDVLRTEDGKLVGEGLLIGITWPHGAARIGMTIFDPEDRGRGYGTEGVRLMVAYGFDALGLQSVSMEFLSSNAGLARLGEAFGGKLVGVLRQKVWAFGSHQDVTIVDAVRDEWEPHPATAHLRAPG